MVKTPNRPTVRCKSQKEWDFLRDIPFSMITFWKKKTLTSLVNYSTLYSWTEITFQEDGKVLDIVQLLDITTRELSSKKLYQDSNLHVYHLDLLELLVEPCCS